MIEGMGQEMERQFELEKARKSVDFSKCQMDKLIAAVKAGKSVEFESYSPYLADNNTSTGEVWDDERLAKADATGLAIASTLREEFSTARLVSLYDEYNSGLPDTTDPRGIPKADGPQIGFSEEAKDAFLHNIEKILRTRGAVRDGDQEGKDYLFVSESSKQKDAEELVRRLEESGHITRDGEAIYFVNPGSENPAYSKIILRTKSGRWLCEALDASSYIKPENLEITHLVVLPNSFREQQDKVWEILKTLGIKPTNYHNIFFDDSLDPAAVAEVIRENIKTAKNT